MESATVNAFKNATNANKNHFSGWFVGIWGQYSNSSEIDEQVTMMSLKKLRDDLNFIMQEYKEKNMNIAAMHTQNFIKKLDAIIKPENKGGRDDGRQRGRDQTPGIQRHHSSTEYTAYSTDRTESFPAENCGGSASG